MVDKEIVEGWLKKADEDFQYAKASLDKNLLFYALICFHLHQAAEKYLKAYIVANELEFRKIHDLTTLLHICEAHDSQFAQLLDLVNDLNPFYIETRYPGFANESVTQAQAEEALQMVEKIASFVRKKLPL